MWQTSQIKAAILVILVQITITSTAKSNARPVHEVINEQARIDEKRSPYTNPLAGNSLQNAKLHAQHQQAMFNAERVRQQRAQLQKWTKAPQQMDSYMKAYHESQENHQLALEQMQAKQQDKKPKPRQSRTQLKERPQLEPVKLTRTDAVEKSRNHRSYGSVYYNGQNRHRINTAPGTTYDQGVTIKPNGNIGLNVEKDQPTLYTEAIPSTTKYIYPKQYSQMHTYQSVEDINALNSLLAKPAQQQLTELNTLITPKDHSKGNSLESPIDLFFYLNDPNLSNNKYAQNAYGGSYSPQFIEYKDHKPITEEIDDIEDPQTKKPFTLKLIQTVPTVPTVSELHDESPTTKSNYYKIEVEQTVSEKFKNIELKEKPSYSEEIVYQKPLTYYTPEPSTEGIKYLHSQHTGVQHLAQDGTGVSAYGEDDIHYAANYEFGYRVKDQETGNDFGHQEAKSGDKTRGQYHVLLPDGRMQQVRYSAGPEGFHADISYDHISSHA